MNNIARRLHQVRQHRNISQARIAKAIGVSVGTIQNYEHGRAQIAADRLKHLAIALQCEPADLLADPGSPLPRYRFRYPRYRFRNSLIGVILASLAPATPDTMPELVLHLEQLTDNFDRIDPDDLA